MPPSWNCSVALNSSGDPLFKRGYRKRTGPAPLNEVLAAGLIRLSGWNKTDDFYDLMCGSGTILIEAALMSLHMPPGMFRRSFGFEKWKSFDPDLWKSVREQANKEIRLKGANIIGSDISRKMIFKYFPFYENKSLLKIFNIKYTMEFTFINEYLSEWEDLRGE